jgi:hypothetical protein
VLCLLAPSVWFITQIFLHSCRLLSQTEAGSLPRPGVSGDADKLLELLNSLAAKQSDKVEVDEGLLRKFASGAV